MITRFKIYEELANFRTINVTDFFIKFENIWEDNKDRLIDELLMFKNTTLSFEFLKNISADNIAEQLITNLLKNKKVEIEDNYYNVSECTILYQFGVGKHTKIVVKLHTSNDHMTDHYRMTSGDIKIYGMNEKEIELLDKIDEIHAEKKFNV